jgi:hypothetical protein
MNQNGGPLWYHTVYSEKSYLLIQMLVMFRVFTPCSVFRLFRSFGGTYSVHPESYFIITWTRFSSHEDRDSMFLRNVGTKQVNHTVQNPEDDHRLNKNRGEPLKTYTLSCTSIFCPENEGSSFFFRNVGNHLRYYTVSWPKWPQCAWLAIVPLCAVFDSERGYLFQAAPPI